MANKEVKATYLAHQVESVIEYSDVFQEATSAQQIEVIDDMIDMLQRWRNMLYDKMDNESD